MGIISDRTMCMGRSKMCLQGLGVEMILRVMFRSMDAASSPACIFHSTMSTVGNTDGYYAPYADLVN